MLYSSIEETLLTAGLENNSDITDALVNSKLLFAKGIIDGVIGDIYQLPLGLFYKNKITFTGTGTSTATMTVTIGGNDFALSVISGLSATQVADLLRNAIIDDTDDSIELDEIQDGAIVRIISHSTGSATPVTITSTDPQTVGGITATGGTVEPVAQGVIRQISMEIAAALLLKIAYGDEAEGSDKDGQARFEQALDMLTKIKEGDIKLYDNDGTELTTATTARMGFYPNDTSSDGSGDEDDTSQRFKVNEEF